MKPISYSILLLSMLLFSSGVCISEESNEPILITTDTTKGAKINIYCYDSISNNVKGKPVLLVHGFNSSGSIWYSEDEKKNYVKNLRKNGYDVIVVDMRGNPVDTDGDHKADTPVVGNSWGYGIRDLGDDVGVALKQGMDYLNKNLPDRNYKKADVITHSTGGLAVTAYSRSIGLVPYRNDIDRIIELGPPNNGSTNLAANIKNILSIIPSVFTQSMIAYQYALELSENKIWIPGSRIESENLRKELSPDSMFLKSIQDLGPDKRIKTFIAIGNEDWVVGDWSPVIEKRDDIGYEYFLGIDHFSFYNSETVLAAILDKLEKGDASNLFSRFKPYRNKQLAFLSGPGIDHPDDTFDIVNFAKGIDISPRKLFDLYLRIGARKDKAYLLKYWEMLTLFEEAQLEISIANDTGVIIDKWDTALAEKNRMLQDYYIYASRQLLECPDIAILANGYYNELRKLVIEKLEEPVRLIDHTFDPYILDEQRILVIPSGGLSGLSNSAIFRNKLSKYVENGGTLICLSQQYGYDFNALPAGGLKAYGWQEDASCHTKAAYIENFHQALSSQKESRPDIKLDGYFTDYPAGSKILLRRTKNLMPSMLMYNFGKGTVIALTLYSDWGYLNGQASTSEINLIRDILRWAKSSEILSEYKPGEDFEKSITPSRDFSRIEMLLRSPDGSILERGISNEGIYRLGITLERPGIYYVDYLLYDADSKIIQPQTEGFYFSFSQAPPMPSENTNFTFDITTDGENYISGSPATFTFHIRNNTARDELIKYKAKLPHHKIEYNDTVRVPGNAIVSFDKGIIAISTDLLTADFYSSENVFIGKAERGINVFEPIVDVDLTSDKRQYLPGEGVSISIDLENRSSVSLDILIVLDVLDSGNNQIYYKSSEARVDRLNSYSWIENFSIPKDVSNGLSRARLSAFSNSRLAGFKGISFEVPKPQLTIKEDLPSALIAGAQNEIRFYLENPLDMASLPGSFKLRFISPDNIIIWQDMKNFEGIPAHKDRVLDFVAHIPDNLKIGNYRFTYLLSYAGEEKDSEIKLEFKPYILFESSKTSFSSGEDLEAEIRVVNNGIFEIEKDIHVNISEFGYTISRPVKIKSKAKTKLPISAAIPQDAAAAAYSLQIEFPGITGLKNEWQFFINTSNLRIIHSEDEFYLENIGGVDTGYVLDMALKGLKGEIFKQGKTEGRISHGERIDIDFEMPENLVSGEYILNVECIDMATLKNVYLEKAIQIRGVEADLIISMDNNYQKGAPIPGTVKVVNKGERIDSSSLDIRVFPGIEIGDLWGIIRDDKGIIAKGASINGIFTNKDGRYRLNGLEKGKNSINVSMPGFDKLTKDIEILPGDNQLDLNLTPAKYGNLSGVIGDSIGSVVTIQPLDVAGSDASIRYAVTSGEGQFRFRYVPIGDYLFTVSPGNISKNIEIVEGENTLDDAVDPGIYQDFQEIEPNNIFTNANEVNLNSRLHGKIYNIGDEDCFKFNVQEKGTLYIKMYEVPQGLRPSIKIYDTKGKMISMKGGSANERIILEIEFDKLGQYYLLVRDWYGNISSLTDYSLDFFFIKTLDEYEPNDTKESARLVDFGKNYFATIATKGDSDFYKASIPDAGKVIVYLRDMPQNIRPYMKLYKDSGQVIDIKGGVAGEDVTMEIDVNNPINYYLQVYDRYNSESSFLRYILTAVYIPANNYAGSEVTYFQKHEDIHNIKDEKEIKFDIPGIGQKGKYYIEALLSSSISQEIAKITKPFYILDGDILLDMEIEKRIYRPDEDIQVKTIITNNSQEDLSSLEFILSIDDAELFRQSFDLMASGQREFQNSISSDKSFTIAASLASLKVKEIVEVEPSQLSLEILAPDVVGKEDFKINLYIENKSRVNGFCKIILLKDNIKVDEKEPVIKPESISLIEFTQNIKKDTEFKIVFEGDIQKEAVKDIRFGEKIEIVFPEDEIYTEGDFSVPVKFINRGELDAGFDFTYKINGVMENTKNYFVPKGGFYEDNLNLSLEPGVYHLIYSCDYSIGYELINVIAKAPEIKIQDIQVSYLENEELSFNAGDKARFRFKAVNQGTTAGAYDINFKFQDLINDTQSSSLEPGMEEEIVFEFLLPEDMEEGRYEAEYKFKEGLFKKDFKISGVRIEVEADVGEAFRLNIKNKSYASEKARGPSSEVPGLSLFAEVRCGDYEKRIDFLLQEEKGLEFYIPDLDKKDRIYYGIYFASGKALYLNSYLIKENQEPRQPSIRVIKAACDKDVYQDGDDVLISWRIDSDSAYPVRLILDLIAPDSNGANIINEDINLEKGINNLDSQIHPELKVPGIYRVMYKILYNESIITNGSLFFDVGKEELKPNHVPVLFDIGEKEVFAGELLEFFIEAIDIDNDLLIYSVESLPKGASFDPWLKRFFWKPKDMQAGDYFVNFIVSDGKAKASERVKITVFSLTSIVPEAIPMAEPLIGMAPLEVHFSSQAIGNTRNIIKYEWDFDGRGVYDFSSYESGDASFIYTGAGDFPAKLRVANKNSTTNIYTVPIKVENNPGAPAVYLEALPLKGVAPCKVFFKGDAFCTAGIAKYEWDFNGDGVYDAGSLESAEVVKTYTAPGTYNAEFRVTSLEGLTGSRGVLIEIEDPKVLSVKSIIEGINPLGVHQDSLKPGFQNQGNVPVEINFDAVIEGKNSIQKYQWDFEGDGIFDFTSLGSGKVKHTYYEPGIYMSTIRITDENNISKEDKIEIRFSIFDLGDIKKYRLIADPGGGRAPCVVKFYLSPDPEIDDTEYFWDFDGNGACDLITSLPEAEFTYDDSGAYMAEVDVKSGGDSIMTRQEIIYITNGKDNGKKAIIPGWLESDKKDNVSRKKTGRIELSDKTSLVLPAGILQTDDVVNIKRLKSSEINKEINIGQIVPAGEYREYKFETHKDPFDKEMVISIPYTDGNNDGIIDDKGIDELTLDAYWYDDKEGKWKILSDSLIFPQENLVTVKTSHFTIFGIGGIIKQAQSMFQPENPVGENSGINGGGGGGGSGGSCFIATAAFGTPLANEVTVLSEFRDKVLLKNKIGHRLVSLYYSISPPIAEFIKDKPFLKSVIRFCIKFLVISLKIMLQ